MNGTLNLIKKWYVSPIKFVLLLCHSILQAGHYSRSQVLWLGDMLFQ